MSRTFTGSPADYFEVTTLGDIPVTVPLTISCWFRPDLLTSEYCLVSIADSASGNNWFELMMEATTGAVRAGDRDSGGQGQATTSNGSSTSIDHHACGIFTGTQDRTAVLNGDWANRGTETATTVTPSSLDRLRIGYRADSSPNTPYNGRMSFVSIWSAALNQVEVEALANHAAPWLIRPGSLVACWPLNETLATDNAVDVIGDHTGDDATTEPGVNNNAPPIMVSTGPSLRIVSAATAASIAPQARYYYNMQLS